MQCLPEAMCYGVEDQTVSGVVREQESSGCLPMHLLATGVKLTQ